LTRTQPGAAPAILIVLPEACWLDRVIQDGALTDLTVIGTRRTTRDRGWAREKNVAHCVIDHTLLLLNSMPRFGLGAPASSSFCQLRAVITISMKSPS